MRRINYNRLTQKKVQTKYAIETRFFYDMADHKAYMRCTEEKNIVWLNLLREFMHDALSAELKRYTEHVKVHGDDDAFVPWLGYHTSVRALRCDGLTKPYTDEKIRLHKAFYVIHSKTGKPVNPHLVWLMRDKHKVDDVKLFQHVLDMMVEEGSMEEIIAEMSDGREYYSYRPTVTIKRKRFVKQHDNPFVENDIRFMETGHNNVAKGVNVETRTRKGRKKDEPETNT